MTFVRISSHLQTFHFTSFPAHIFLVAEGSYLVKCRPNSMDPIRSPPQYVFVRLIREIWHPAPQTAQSSRRRCGLWPPPTPSSGATILCTTVSQKAAMPQTQMALPASLSTGAGLRQVNNILPRECLFGRTLAGGFSNEGPI